ncbi:MAG: lysylphosphatidylglycerol synthase transmembrane domain-containing protein [Candidatus Omnitrophota bacterium]
MGKKLSFAFRILVAAALIFALFKFVPYQELIGVYRRSNKFYLVLAFVAFFSSYFLGAHRWKILLRALGIKISFKESFYCGLSSLFFNLFFPSFVAGDIFRSVSISQRHGKTKQIASSVLMDRFSGSCALSLVSGGAFIFGILLGRIPAERKIFIPLFILGSLVGVVSVIIFSRRVFTFLTGILRARPVFRKKLINFHDQLYFFRTHPRVFLKSLIFSGLIQALTPISFFISARAFGVDISFIYFLILVPVIMAIALIPITIAGAGTREAAAVYFFALVGVENSVSLGMSLLNLAFSVLSGIIGGIFYVIVYHRWLQSRS